MNEFKIYDELWTDNETGEVITATEAIRRHYQTADILSDWTKYYTFTGEYSDQVLDFPDFSQIERYIHS